MRILNKTPHDPRRDIPVEVVYWYDHDSRNWVVQVRDYEGNQCGDADYRHSMREAKRAAGFRAENAGVTVVRHLKRNEA